MNSMKRILSLVVVTMIIISIIPIACLAQTDNSEKIIMQYSDGSYITESVTEYAARASGTKTGTKTRTYYSSNGTTLWKVVLTGSFSFTGTSSTCASSSCNATIYDSAWYVISKSSGKSGNTATASATIGERVLGVTVSRVPVELTLTCDANGNLC